MSNELYVVGYEGGDRTVVDYAAKRARKAGAKLHIVHILEWSPYSFLTPEEIEERHKRRNEELVRAREVLLDPLIRELAAEGVQADGELRFGSVVDLLAEIAEETKAEMIFVGRAGASSLSARVFGSVPIGLAQAAPVPVVIVP